MAQAEEASVADRLTLVVLAAGLSSRFGAPKQLEVLGPGGSTLLDYALHDARRVGVTQAVFVTRPELEPDLRRHFDARWRGKLPIAYVHQGLDDVPVGFTVPAQRRKPWGTGHAALAGLRAADSPSLVINADDFYGADAFQLVAQMMTESGGPVTAAYRLADTLAPTGHGVSRGLLETAKDRLVSVTEVYDVRRAENEIVGRTGEGRPLHFTGEELVSVNLWGATPDVVTFLEQAFRGFLAELGHATDAEFLIGAAVNLYVASGAGDVQVVPVPGSWIGITHPDDAPFVRERLATLVAEGAYPHEIPGP